METMTHHEITLMLFALAILLGVARVLGELAQWLHQPTVVGELLAGVLLGPTILGAIAPSWHAAIFPAEGHVAVFFSGMAALSITLFLLVAGMEVDLSTAWQQGTVALKVSFMGTVIPFLIGFGLAWQFPLAMGGELQSHRMLFALFFATALSISALPVIAKTLIDLGLFRSDLGMIIISAAVLNDLIGWLIFALILGWMGASAESNGSEVGTTVVLVLLFAGLMLTLGRVLIHRALPYIQAYSHWPGGVLGFCFSLTLLGAAFTEWIGVHGIFGAFLVGVAIGDSSHLREQTRTTIDHFVSFIFAPLFFASIGLHVDFVDHFDGLLVLTVLGIACSGKFLGCWLGGWWAGLSHSYRLAVGAGMNARGAMEIILGLLALKAGLISMRLFVALVVMAIVTSVISGPLMQLFLHRRKARPVTGYLSSARYLPKLNGTTRNQVIEQLTHLACAQTQLDPRLTTSAVLSREEIMPTGIGNGVAIPHARLLNLTTPIVVLGVSESGLDFNSPDGMPVHLVFLVLTPLNDYEHQLEIMEGLALTLRSPQTVERICHSRSLTEVIAIMKSSGSSN